MGSGSQALRQGPSRPEREQLGVVASVGGADAQAGDVGICAGEAAGLQKGGDVLVRGYLKSDRSCLQHQCASSGGL